MSKLVYYIRNGFYSSLVGAGAQIIIDIVQQKKSVDVFSLLESMSIGILIGTVSMFFYYQIILKKKIILLYGLISNFIVVFAMVMLFAVYHCIQEGTQQVMVNWIIALCVSEVLSSILIIYWCSYFTKLNTQLDKKKADILK